MWQFIVIIKFEQAYLKKPDVFNALMQFIKDSLQGQSDLVMVTICIYSDVNPSHFLTNVTGALSTININSKYILFLNAYNSNQTSGNENYQTHTTLTNSSIDVSYTSYQPMGGLLRPQELGELFKKIKPENTEDKTLLFLLDHGSAFAIFGEQEIIPTPLLKSKSENFAPINSKISQPKYYDLLENEVDFRDVLLNAGDIQKRLQFNKNYKFLTNPNDPVIFYDAAVVEPLNLTMDELAQALKIARFKPDVLVLANCYMLCVDTLYALRNSAKVIVGSSTAITYEMFNIISILKSLAGKDIKEASSLFIKSAENSEREWIPDDRTGRIESVKNRIALFAIDLVSLNQYPFWESLRGCIDQTIDLFTRNNDTKKLVQKSAKLTRFNVLIDYKLPYYFIDTFAFFSRVRSNAQSLIIDDSFFEFINTYNNQFSQSDNVFIGDVVKNTSYSCSGPSIKFPYGKNNFDCRFIRLYYNGSNQNPHRSSFCRDFEWDYFLYLWYSELI